MSYLQVNQSCLLDSSLLSQISLSSSTVPLGIAAITLQASLYDVPGGYRAVMFDRFQGVKPNPSHEGTHFLVPFIQRAILYDVRVKPRNISTTTGSKDLQMVSVITSLMGSRIERKEAMEASKHCAPLIGNQWSRWSLLCKRLIEISNQIILHLSCTRERGKTKEFQSISFWHLPPSFLSITLSRSL